MVCWRFYTGLLNFHKGSLICRWVSESVFFRGSWTTSERGRSLFGVHSLNQSLYAYYLMRGWARLLLGPWYMVEDFVAPTGALLSGDRYLIIVVEGGYSDRLLIWPFWWHHSWYQETLPSLVPQLLLFSLHTELLAYLDFAYANFYLDWRFLIEFQLPLSWPIWAWNLQTSWQCHHGKTNKIANSKSSHFFAQLC